MLNLGVHVLDKTLAVEHVMARANAVHDLVDVWRKSKFKKRHQADLARILLCFLP